MNFRNRKFLWMAAVLVLVLFIAYFVKNKFRLSSPAPRVHQKTVSITEIPGKKFAVAIPIVFKVEKYNEIRFSKGDAFNPKVSPDGSWIVFIKRLKGKNYVALANLKTNDTDTLKFGLDDCADPSWNVDGTKIAFAGLKRGVSEIYLYDLQEGNLHRVTNDPRRKKSWPRFSPYRFDGNYRIAYTSEANGRKDIWWVRESGEFDDPVTAPPERAAEFRNLPYWKHYELSPPDLVNKGGDCPEWSPSGDIIIYRTGGYNYAALAYGNREWWHEGEIPFPSSPGLLSWSPNQMSFLDYDPSNGSSLVVSRDDLKKKPVLVNRPLTSAPAWFPDGRGFAYTYTRDGRSVLAMEPYDDPLGDVANLWMYSFDGNRRNKLARNNLLFTDANCNHIFTPFDSDMYADKDHVHAKPNLVTSDAVLETYYAAYSAFLVYVERREFAPEMKEFAIYGAKVAREKKVTGDVERLFLTGLALVDPVAGKSMPREVRKEVAQIEKAKGKGTSLFGRKISYADFSMRDKYERDKYLQRYFQALKWFRSFTFDLGKEEDQRYVSEILRVTASPEVYRPLARINTALKEIFGGSGYYGPLTLKEYRPGGKIPVVQPALPWIEFRNDFNLFPPACTLDDQIFEELITHAGVAGTVEASGPSRLLPLGMDIMAAFGSDEARGILMDEFKEGRFADYRGKLDGMTGKIRRYPPKTWDENLYQNWLGVLASLVREPGEKSPAFTRTGAWKRKLLNTALGSWVNLRYGTTDYDVEEAAIEAGEVGYERIDAGLPRGYVEPDPEFFHGLDKAFARISERFARSIVEQDLQKAVTERIAEYRVHLQSLERIARKELNNEPLGDAEYGEINDIGEIVENFIIFMDGMGGNEGEDTLKITDAIRKNVEIQLHPFNNSRLYETLGFVNRINVAVPYYGRREIVIGPVYSYYEYRSGSQSTRVKWRATAPRRHPAWIEPYYADKAGSMLQVDIRK